MPLSKKRDRMRKRLRRLESDALRANSRGIEEEMNSKLPAILYALADIPKRAKLRAICESLKNHGV